MEVLIDLFKEMASIGLISFGGGWSALGILQEHLTDLGWIDAEGFSRIIALAQVTPGPVALNAATLMGYKHAQGIGAVVSTLALVLPGIVIMIMGKFILNRNLLNKKSVVSALGIASVSLLLFTIFRLITIPGITWWMLIIAGLVATMGFFGKVPSILLIVGGMVLGAIVRQFLGTN